MIAPDHPALAGHLPGAPLVPGVVLLDETLRLVLPAGTRPALLPGLKFLGEVRPGQSIAVAARAGDGAGRIEFEGREGGRLVLRGSVGVLG